jgi:hypothetical protein
MRVFSPACIAAVACCLSNCSILPRSISGRVRSEDLITASGENDLSVTDCNISERLFSYHQ